MWILKEAWGEEDENGKVSGGGHSIYDSWDETAIGIRTWDVMMYVIYGIRQLQNRVEYCNMPKADEQMMNLLKQCAYINISKMPGRSRSGNLKMEYALWNDIISDQIRAYNPDVIIFGGTFDFMKKMGNPIIADSRYIDKTPSEVAHLYRDKDGRLLLNAMHPAQTTIGREWYVDEIADAIRANYMN